MRHRKRSFKIGANSAHRRCLMANMLKSLIEHGRIETRVSLAKELRRHADRMITLAKKDTLASRRLAMGRLMVRFNPLTSKEARAAKAGDTSAYNGDRTVVKKLFGELGPRFLLRKGGYTRIMRTETRTGDAAEKCVIEFVG